MKRFLLTLLALAAGAYIGITNTPDTSAQIGYQVTASSVSSAAFPLLGPADSVAAPNYSWTADPDTGIHNVSANNVGIVAGGALRYQVRATNQAGSGASLNTIDATLGNMDGSDTVYGLHINLISSTGHTGSPNIINALKIANLIADGDVTESAVSIGTGWDSGLEVGTSTAASIFLSGNDHHFRYSSNDNLTFGDGALTGAIVLDLNAFPNSVANFANGYMVGIGDGTDTIASMDGSDTYAMVEIDFTNADHTGTGNTLNLLNIDAITGDAEANLNAINIGALTGTTGAAGEVEAALRIGTGWDVDVAYLNDLIIAEDASTASRVYIRDRAATNASEAGGTLEIATALLAMNGSDEVVGFGVDITNADHTGTGNTLNLISIEPITGDANSNLNAIDIGALTGTTGAVDEVENAIKIQGGWDTAIEMDDTNAEYFGFSGGNGGYQLESGTDAYFMFPTVEYAAHGGGSIQGTAANTTYLYRGYVPKRMTVSRMAFELVTGGGAGAECGVAIYNVDGSVQIATADGIACEVANQGVIDTDVTDFVIGPGYYLFGWTGDDGNLTVRGLNTAAATGFPGILNSTSAQMGTGANASVQGEFPVTTGALSGASQNAPFIKLQGS